MCKNIYLPIEKHCVDQKGHIKMTFGKFSGFDTNFIEHIL